MKMPQSIRTRSSAPNRPTLATAARTIERSVARPSDAFKIPFLPAVRGTIHDRRPARKLARGGFLGFEVAIRSVPVCGDFVQERTLARRAKMAQLSNESIHPELLVHRSVLRCNGAL